MDEKANSSIFCPIPVQGLWWLVRPGFPFPEFPHGKGSPGVPTGFEEIFPKVFLSSPAPESFAPSWNKPVPGPKGYNPPDFVEIANAYKIKTFKINNNDEIENLLDEILNYNGPVVCDVNCHEFHAYEPKLIGWKTPIEDMYPYLKRNELKNNLNIKMHESSNNPFMPDVTTKIETMEWKKF